MPWRPASPCRCASPRARSDSGPRRGVSGGRSAPPRHRAGARRGGLGAGRGPVSGTGSASHQDDGLAPQEREQRLRAPFAPDARLRGTQMEAIRQPAAVEPVRVILSIRWSWTSSSDTSRSAVRTSRTPAGRPASSAASAKRYASAGASGEALRPRCSRPQGRRDRERGQPEEAVPRDDRAHHEDRLAHQATEPGSSQGRSLLEEGTRRPGRRRTRTRWRTTRGPRGGRVHQPGLPGGVLGQQGAAPTQRDGEGLQDVPALRVVQPAHPRTAGPHPHPAARSQLSHVPPSITSRGEMP